MVLEKRQIITYSYRYAVCRLASLCSLLECKLTDQTSRRAADCRGEWMLVITQIKGKDSPDDAKPTPSVRGHLAESPSPLLRDLQPGHPERRPRSAFLVFTDSVHAPGKVGEKERGKVTPKRCSTHACIPNLEFRDV